MIADNHNGSAALGSEPTAPASGPAALDELYWRAEILQALYWMGGEGLADTADAATLATFLVADEATIATHLALLATQGYLEPLPTIAEGKVLSAEQVAPGSTPARPVSPLSTQHSALSTRRYRLTAQGIAEGGRSFRDEFADLTRAAHYECSPGCWCHDPERADEPCPTHPERPPTPAPSPTGPGHDA